MRKYGSVKGRMVAQAEIFFVTYFTTTMLSRFYKSRLLEFQTFLRLK
jgi:hypothetical protein